MPGGRIFQQTQLHHHPNHYYFYWRRKIASSLLLLVSSSSTSSSSSTYHITSPASAFLLHPHHHNHRGFSSFATAAFISTTATTSTIKTRNSINRSYMKRNNIINMKMSSSSSSSQLQQQQQQEQNNFPTVSEFLISAKKKIMEAKTKTEEGGREFHIAIGNPAGDADSIISSIAISYINNKNYLPIISIPIKDLQYLRPETKYLLELAGISVVDFKNHFIGIDDDDIIDTYLLLSNNNNVNVTLVDHNKLTIKNQNDELPPSWKVIEIFDHHIDEMAHTDTCPPPPSPPDSFIKPHDDDDDEGSSISHNKRIIAFDPNESKALVASTCTLMVEHFLSKYSSASTNFPPTLSILLLGVILLDSINLLPKAGKVTQRDINAVQYLHQHTDWSQLKLPSEILLLRDEDGDDDESISNNNKPNLTKLFDTLQNQKFHPNFWNSLSVQQAIKLDYKSFTVVKDDDATTTTFGMSSILQTKEAFFGNNNQLKTKYVELRKELDNKNVGLLILMFCDFSDGTPRRQLAWICNNKELSKSLLNYLIEDDGTLQLQEIEEVLCNDDDGNEYVILQMNQGNTKASRKQVAPIIMEFFKNQ